MWWGSEILVEKTFCLYQIAMFPVRRSESLIAQKPQFDFG